MTTVLLLCIRTRRAVARHLPRLGPPRSRRLLHAHGPSAQCPQPSAVYRDGSFYEIKNDPPPSRWNRQTRPSCRVRHEIFETLKGENRPENRARFSGRTVKAAVLKDNPGHRRMVMFKK